MKYSEAVARLDEIIAIIENNNPDVDLLMQLTEEGVKLITFCKEKLDVSDKKMELLLSSLSDNLENNEE